MEPTQERLPENVVILELPDARDRASERFTHTIYQQRMRKFADLKKLYREVKKAYKKERDALKAARRAGAVEEAGALTLVELLKENPGYSVGRYEYTELEVVEAGGGD